MVFERSISSSQTAIPSSSIEQQSQQGRATLDSHPGLTATDSNTNLNDAASTTAYEQFRRQISSVVVVEELLASVPKPTIRYVEVPVIQEVVRQVSKKQVIEIEKVVPKYEVEYIERIVEVPEIRYIDKTVEKTEIVEVVRHVPKTQIKEIPREVIRKVPKIEYKTIEKIVEIPGEVIEVPVEQIVRKEVEVPQIYDKETPVVVAQTIRPIITTTAEPTEIDIYHYEPQVIPVDVLVAKPIASKITPIGAQSYENRFVSVPATQYNSILRSLNPHLKTEDLEDLPYIRETDGTIQFLDAAELAGVVLPSGLDAHESENGTVVIEKPHLHNTPSVQPLKQFDPATYIQMVPSASTSQVTERLDNMKMTDECMATMRSASEKNSCISKKSNLRKTTKSSMKLSVKKSGCAC